jgi:hypothetical protein
MTTGYRHAVDFALSTAVAACFALAAGCGFEHSTTGPSSTEGSALRAYVGDWISASAAAGLPSLDSCTNLKWNPTTINGNSASGTFSATCGGGVTLDGTGSGTLNGSKLNWNATGQATAPGPVTCGFTLSGTAEPEGADRIKVTFFGTTCVSAVSGTEILKRK